MRIFLNDMSRSNSFTNEIDKAVQLPDVDQEFADWKIDTNLVLICNVHSVMFCVWRILTNAWNNKKNENYRKYMHSCIIKAIPRVDWNRNWKILKYILIIYSIYC